MPRQRDGALTASGPRRDDFLELATPFGCDEALSGLFQIVRGKSSS